MQELQRIKREEGPEALLELLEDDEPLPEHACPLHGMVSSQNSTVVPLSAAPQCRRALPHLPPCSCAREPMCRQEHRCCACAASGCLAEACWPVGGKGRVGAGACWRVVGVSDEQAWRQMSEQEALTTMYSRLAWSKAVSDFNVRRALVCFIAFLLLFSHAVASLGVQPLERFAHGLAHGRCCQKQQEGQIFLLPGNLARAFQGFKALAGSPGHFFPKHSAPHVRHVAERRRRCRGWSSAQARWPDCLCKRLEWEPVQGSEGASVAGEREAGAYARAPAVLAPPLLAAASLLFPKCSDMLGGDRTARQVAALAN